MYAHIQIRRLWLTVPVIVANGTDVLCTLWYQPAAYWNGAYRTATEYSPLWRVFLSRNPWLFVAATALWIGLCAMLVLVLPRRGAMVIAMTFLLWHTMGAYSWISYYAWHGYWAAAGFCAVIAVITVYCWERGVR